MSEELNLSAILMEIIPGFVTTDGESKVLQRNCIYYDYSQSGIIWLPSF